MSSGTTGIHNVASISVEVTMFDSFVCHSFQIVTEDGSTHRFDAMSNLGVLSLDHLPLRDVRTQEVAA
jgi:hypothetical protein